MIQQSISKHAGLIIICLLFFLVGILRLNDLSLLNPDSSRYLIWGNSLAHGKGFVDDTQPEPDRYVVHAPLYSIIIAPIELFFPLSLTAVKIWTLLWGVFALVLFYLWMNQIVGRIFALLSTIFLACNPLTIVYSTEVLSEAPFLVFVLLVLILSEKIVTVEANKLSLALMLVVAVTATTMLREVGIAIVLVTMIFFLSHGKKKITGLIFLSALIFTVLWYLRNNSWIGPVAQSQTGNLTFMFQHFVTTPDAPLVNELALRVWVKFSEYFMHLSGMLFYPLYITMQFKLNLFPSQLHQFFQWVMSWGKYVILLCTFPIIGYGIYLDVRSSKTSALKLLFAVCYLGIVFLYPAYDIRFLLPVLPLMLYYFFLSVKQYIVSKELTGIFRRDAYLITAAVFLVIPNLSSIYEILKINLAYRENPVKFYETVHKMPSYPLMFTQPWSLMGQWIKSNLPDSVVLASSSKELSTVVGERKVVEIDQGTPMPVFETLLRDNHVEYLQVPNRREDFTVFEFAMRESKRFWFEPVYRVANLNLFRVRSRLKETVPNDIAQTNTTDSVSATALLLEGRKELIAEHYERARNIFIRSMMLDSTHPEILYQTIIAHAMLGDTIGVEKYYRKLFSLPQALGYTMPARLQLQAMHMLSEARAQSFPASVAVQSFNAATLYWKLGFYRRAAHILDIILDVDSTYFNGLLWGLHYNLQNNETVKAKKYLAILENMDRTNPVVQAFRQMLAIGDSLQLAICSSEKSNFHLRIAILYKQIELNEEAIDEGELALKENPNNVDALVLIAQMFERKSNLQMAERTYWEVLTFEPQNMAAVAKVDSIRKELSRR